MCGSELKVERGEEKEKKRRGFRIEAGRDKQRLTGEGGEGRREGEALWVKKVMREGEQVHTHVKMYRAECRGSFRGLSQLMCR